MLKKSLQVASKVAGTFMATTLALAVTAPNAKALDFTFSGVTAGSLSASGTFRISDTAVANETLTQADILDWQIDVDTNSGGVNDYTLFGDAGGFGTTNSFITLFSGGSVNSSQLELFGDLDISGVGFGQSFRIGDVENFLGDGVDDSESSENFGNDLIAVAASTPVPFGVIPDTGIGILAGMWGISRLRKTMTARKAFSK